MKAVREGRCRSCGDRVEVGDAIAVLPDVRSEGYATSDGLGPKPSDERILHHRCVLRDGTPKWLVKAIQRQRTAEAARPGSAAPPEAPRRPVIPDGTYLDRMVTAAAHAAGWRLQWRRGRWLLTRPGRTVWCADLGAAAAVIAGVTGPRHHPHPVLDKHTREESQLCAS